MDVGNVLGFLRRGREADLRGRGEVFEDFPPRRIVGRTDSQGGVSETEAYTPEDLAATIFQCLGIGPDREFHDSSGRPFRVYRGQPIQALL